MSNYVLVNKFNKRFKETDKERREREAKEEKEAKEAKAKEAKEKKEKEKEKEKADAEREKNKKTPAQKWAEFVIFFFLLFIFGVFQFSLFRTYLNIPVDATKSPYMNGIPYKWAHGDSWFGKFFGGTLINCWRDLRFAFQKYFMVGNKIKTQLAPELEGNDMLNLAKGGLKFWALIVSGFIYLIMSILLVLTYGFIPLIQTIRGMFGAAGGNDLAVGLIGVFFTFWPIVIFTYFFQVIYVFFYPIKAIIDGTFMKETTNAFKAENRGGQLYQFFFWLLLFIGILFIKIGGDVGLWGAIICFSLLGLHILFMVLNFTGLSKKIAKKMTKAKREVRQDNRRQEQNNPLIQQKMQGGKRKKRKK